MNAPGIIEKDAATKRILNAGFSAIAEYDQFGRLVAAGGVLSSEYAWTRVAQIAQSRAGIETEEKATAILLGDMFVAALDLEGGGTLLAISEQLVTDAAAEKLTSALDTAVGEYIGPIPAPLAVLGCVLILTLIIGLNGKSG
jgi:hypothetical protein